MANENDAKTLMDLKKKRAVIKAALTRIRTFVTNFDPREQALSLLEFRQEELPVINKKFDEVQSQIELLMFDDMDDAEAERDKFENDYFSIRSHIQEITNLERSHLANGLAHSSFTSTHRQRAQLTPIPLPKFSGNIQEWSSFFDIFKAMVHTEEGYSPAQKFFYLRSCLEGAALDLVRAIPVSDGNYDVIIEQLIRRYDNRSLVIQSHIRSILDCPKVEEAAFQTLQELHSTMGTHVAALKAMGQPVEHWDAWLVTIIVSRLDKSTAHSWQLHQRNSELPRYYEIEAFLASRCVALKTSESYALEASGIRKSVDSRRQIASATSKKTLLAADNKSSRSCPCCKEVHKLYSCEKFKQLKISERLDLVRGNRLCFNCLAPYHTVDNCKSHYSCKRCNRKHNTILHFENTEDQNQLQGQPSNAALLPVLTNAQQPSARSMMSLSKPQEVTHVFLATAIVAVRDDLGVYRKCRAVLDSGSQLNFISKRFAKLLQLPSKKAIMPISGIGASTTQCSNSIDIHMQSCIKNFSTHLSCHILPVIVDELPPVQMPKEGWQIPKPHSSLLADPSFCESGPIELLIGCGIFFELMEAKRIPLAPGTLCLQDSKLGWIVTGGIGITSLIATSSIGQVCEDKFRILCKNELEAYSEPTKSNKKCIKEQKALRHFEKTMRRDETGRFVLRLPLKPEKCKLGSTLEMATARFLSVERRLQKNEELKMQYIDFMDEYLRMGHMKKVCQELDQSEYLFYLPHHPVIKLSSLTTKLRVVFDASAKSSSNVSLNDVLMCGPTVQEDLFSILTRFRRHQFVITADIEKMFRQINVASEDQDLQRIVWRAQPDEALQLYRLTTVTYGTTAASFMATNCLISLAEATRESHPKVSRIIQRDFYMDDLMTGADTIEECCQVQQQINMILDSAKLTLRKWCSNSRNVLKHIGNSNTDPLFALQINADDVIKSLGLSWKPERDEFQFTVENNTIRTKATKRMLLSDLNKIFDPLGFLAPVLVRGKIFLQQLWQLKIDWDKPLDADLTRRWECFYKGLNELSCIPIPRKCIPSFSSEVQLHGFCDASEEAYGAAIYARSKDQTGNWTARLLCSKTRVAPLKGSTIPRLELCGALTLAKLVKKTAEAWELENSSIYLWTDSMVVIGWLNSEACRLKTYVANRVEQILEITEPKQWRHVKTNENPADVLSRGLSPKELQCDEQWWQGPRWLSEKSGDWLRTSIILPNEELLPEKKPIRLTLIAVEPTRDLLNYFSTWHKLVRAAVWLLKFIEYRKSKHAGTLTKYLNVADLGKAENGLIRRAQLDSFSEELHALKIGKEVSRSSKLKSLCPFLRDDNLILVGGRLQNSNLTREQKHPVVLPFAHKVTRLIFQDCHVKMLHCGPKLLLSEIRNLYWPLKCRLVARSTIFHCVQCTRASPRFNVPLMAPLPQQRVQCTRPFTITGVDFAGPLTIRSGVRGRVNRKAWISLFICFSTKAIHIEVVEDLTSSSFIATLRRFISRRGKPTEIWSDNATNFVGAQRELAIYLKNIEGSSVDEGITWHFNPPSAPHFGGLWESAVKSAKHHLTRVLKNAKLTLIELQTLLCQIEACLNSRPLTPLSNDPNDLQALTPAHFLIGGPMLRHPEPDLSQEEPNGLRRWRFVQFLMQDFWKRWHNKYLPQLQTRGKWTSGAAPLKINDIVIVKEENIPPARWKLARIVNVHPGSDGRIRVATVRLANGNEVKRPTVKLCRLPVEEESGGP